MLASILPGLRDIRTPLAAGYLWLTVLWLVFADHIPASIESTRGPLETLYRLGALVGTTGVLAAASFGAYLIGSILKLQPILALSPFHFVSQYRDGRSGSSVGRRIFPAGMRRSQGAILSRSASEQIRRLNRQNVNNQQILNAVLSQVTDSVTVHVQVDHALARAMSKQLSAVAIQLQAKNRDLWDSYDRHESEAQFRYSIAPPLAVLVVVYALQSGFTILLLLLLVPVILITLGANEKQMADAVLVEAVNLKIAMAPVQEALNELKPPSPSAPPAAVA